MRKRILLHICCAPCAIHPLRVLREEGYDVTGLFFNPNIHPYQEYRRRLEALEGYAVDEHLGLVGEGGYSPEAFLREVAFRETQRCGLCYGLRLDRTAAVARREGFDVFTTTLLYSRFQRHEMIVEKGRRAADALGLEFLYRDFRKGWSEGVRISKEREIYRQPYCGCIYSEQDRYAPAAGREARKGSSSASPRRP